MSDTGQKVYEVVLRQFRIEPEFLSPDTSFIDLGADSAALVELMINLEEAFDMQMPEASAGSIQTVGHVIAFIDQRRAELLSSSPNESESESASAG
jgi:acyl carrier protein